MTEIPPINPEAIIAATVAAKSAELAAEQTFYVGLAVIAILLAMGAMLMFVFHKMSQILKNQDDFIAEIRERRIFDHAAKENPK